MECPLDDDEVKAKEYPETYDHAISDVITCGHDTFDVDRAP